MASTLPATIPTFSDIDKEPSLPEPQIVYDAAQGLKTVTEHEYDDRTSDLVKVTKVFKHQRLKVSAAVAQRRKWKKYGASAGDPPGPNASNTFPVKEDVLVQLFPRQQPEDQDKIEEDVSLISRAKSNLVCRICKGAHFSHQCPNKSDMEAIKDLQHKLQGTLEAVQQEELNETQTPTPEFTQLGSGSGNRYVPPQMRGTAGASMTGGKRVPEGFTVRVTNLPPDMQIDDLKAVFALYGQIIRIFPAKDKVTQMNRGFAFISYASFDHAQAAVTNLDGFRYNHVVLKVDWAKPSHQ